MNNLLIKPTKSFLSFGLALCLLSLSPILIAQECGTSTLAIPDGDDGTSTPGTVDLPILVPSAAYDTAAISDLIFDLQINHTFTGDLRVTLISPNGTSVILMDRPGTASSYGSPYGCSNGNVDATFDDASGTDVETQCNGIAPAISGSLNPTGALSDFDGEIASGIWVVRVEDNAGSDTGSIIGASTCLNFTTVPVVMGQFKTRMFGNYLTAKWQTVSEAFNIGFNLWGNVDGEWVQLNKRLIKSKKIDSVEPQNYRNRLNLRRFNKLPQEIGISSVSTSGEEEFFGPFRVGDEYGEQSIPKRIDWKLQREKFNKKMSDAGYVWLNNRWVRAARLLSFYQGWLDSRFDSALLTFDKAGVYKVTYEQLKASGVDLKGVRVRHLAVTQKGSPIARKVVGSKRNRYLFGKGGYVLFYVAGVDQEDARYVDNSRVKISANPALVLKAPTLNKKVNADEIANQSIQNQYLTKIPIGEFKEYSFALAGNQPWYDTFLIANGSAFKKTVSFDVPNNADLNTITDIKLKLSGGIYQQNLDVDGDGELEPNHHFKIYLNPDQFPEHIHEGFSEKTDAVDIHVQVQGQLKHGQNTLEIELIPDNGHNLDGMYFLNGSVGYYRLNQFSGSYMSIDLDNQNTEALVFEDANQQVERVYSFDNQQNFSELKFTREDDKILLRTPPFINGYASGIWLSSGDGYLTTSNIAPAARIAEDTISLEQTDYVVIAHPSLYSEALNEFVAYHNQAGRSTKLVNVLDVYQKYSDGLAVPSAISAYLKDQSAKSNFTHVLLVGGHTYDYRGFGNYQDNPPITLIPSFYRANPSNLAKQIPTTVPFVDFDSDGMPDKAIGRWPVRNQQQLKYVVDKTLAWHKGSHKSNQSVLTLSEKTEPLNNFQNAVNRVIAKLGSNDYPWLNQNVISSDEIFADPQIEQGQKVTEIRQRFVDALNQGPALTIFAGHGSPTIWAKQNLVNSAVVEQFTNTETPSLIFPLACYTTYYETPKIKSLSERLFTDNAAGGVALSGPAILSTSSENVQMAKWTLYAMSNKGMDLGSAVLDAMKVINNDSPRMQGVIYNWITLGDPTISFDLPILPIAEDVSEKPVN